MLLIDFHKTESRSLVPGVLCRVCPPRAALGGFPEKLRSPVQGQLRHSKPCSQPAESYLSWEAKSIFGAETLFGQGFSNPPSLQLEKIFGFFCLL